MAEMGAGKLLKKIPTYIAVQIVTTCQDLY